jgi:hypothetical protein
MDQQQDDDSGGAGAGPPSPSGPPGAGAGGSPGGAPGGGGLLAALSQQGQQPQQSAPGPGSGADGIAKLTGAIGLLQASLPGLQPGSPPHKDVLRAIQLLSKHSVQAQPGVQKTMFSDMLQATMRNALLQRLGQSKQGGPGQQAPNPATPRPGA